MKAFSNTFAARNFRKYFYIVVFCANAFLYHPVNAAVTIIRDCPVQCECSTNENQRLTAKCDGRLSWTGISYPDVSRFELQKQGGDGGQTTAPCNFPRSLWRIFPRLSSFDASRCHLSRISNDTFLHLDDLEEVDLSHNRLKTIDRSCFVANEKLKFVNLRDNPLHLDRNSPSLFISSSIFELDLSECNVIAISKHVFDGLPNLKYLSLSSNKIATIGPNVLPSDLRTLNLAANRITNVPIGELLRLENLVEIDLSSNPINCSCELVGLQNSGSANRLLFVNSIKCAYPTRYAGKRLAFLSPYEVCDEWDTATGTASDNVDDENLIFNRRIRSTLEPDGIIIDLSDDDYHDQPNEFIDFRSDNRLKRSAPASEFEGSGDAPEDNDETTSSPSSTSDSTKDSDTSPSSEATSSQSPATDLAKDSNTSPSSETAPSQSSENDSVKGTSPISETTSSQPSIKDSTKDSNISSSSETASSQSSEDDSVKGTSPISETTSSQPSTKDSIKDSDISSSSETASSQSSENDSVKDGDTSSSSEIVKNSDTSSSTVGDTMSSSETMSSQSSAGTVAQSTSTMTETPAETPVEMKSSEVTGTGQADTTVTEQSSSIVPSSTLTAVNLPRSGPEESNPGYVIPIIVIVAIVTGSLSVYVCQHNCRRKTGSQEPSKKGKSATEMRLLMDGHSDHKLESNDRPGNYANEENKEQMEKLITNGDTAIEIVPAGTSVNADRTDAMTDDNCEKDSKTSIRDINENARKKFFQMLVKH